MLTLECLLILIHSLTLDLPRATLAGYIKHVTRRPIDTTSWSSEFDLKRINSLMASDSLEPRRYLLNLPNKGNYQPLETDSIPPNVRLP